MTEVFNISEEMVEEEEEEAETGSDSENEERGGCAEAALMYRVDSIAEVLQQTSHNLALFERLLPAAGRKETDRSPRGQ